jgi:hypothetical protein
MKRRPFQPTLKGRPFVDRWVGRGVPVRLAPDLRWAAGVDRRDRRSRPRIPDAVRAKRFRRARTEHGGVSSRAKNLARPSITETSLAAMLSGQMTSTINSSCGHPSTLARSPSIALSPGRRGVRARGAGFDTLGARHRGRRSNHGSGPAVGSAAQIPGLLWLYKNESLTVGTDGLHLQQGRGWSG